MIPLQIRPAVGTDDLAGDKPGVLRHQVDRPRRIEVDSHTLLAPMTIAVDGRDGKRTLITIESEPDFAD